jgi:UDP-glucose 4-epimerase
MTYLVTGGAGFIGSHIVEKLAAQGRRIRVLDNFSSGKKENLSVANGQAEIMAGDVVDLDVVRRSMEGVSVVFHEAALRSVPFSVENPAVVNRVNVEGTLNVLIAARDEGVERVVFASSSSVYGNAKTMPKSEQQCPEPISPYAVSKLAGEHYCRTFTELYGLETVCLRYFNVFGPRQDPASEYAAVIPRFIQWALEGKSLEVHGDGLQSRDFSYVDNVVEANLLAAESPHVVGGIYNVGQSRSYSLLDLIDLLRSVLQVDVRWDHTEARPGDVRYTLADISRAVRDMAYRPRISFEEGIARTVTYLAQGMNQSCTRVPAENFWTPEKFTSCKMTL